jgi:hypothetical protein
VISTKHSEACQGQPSYCSRGERSESSRVLFRTDVRGAGGGTQEVVF